MALQRIGVLTRFIEGAEKDASDQIGAIRKRLVDETAPIRDALAKNELALKDWAKSDRISWKDKSLISTSGASASACRRRRSN